MRKGYKLSHIFPLAALAILGPATGAVAHASTVFNVQTFGATGDGRTDDGPALQHAIDAAVAAGPGNEVFLPAGNYLLGADFPRGPWQLLINNATNFTLAGEAGTNLVSGAPEKNIISITNSLNVDIHSLALRRQRNTFSEVTVKAIDIPSHTVTVSVQPGNAQLDDSMIAEANLLLVASANGDDSWGDHLADCAWYNPKDSTVCWPPQITGRTHLPDGQWLLQLNTAPVPTDLGQSAYVWGAAYKGRALSIVHTKNFQADDISYYPGGTDGAFVLSRDSGNFTFHRLTEDVPLNSNQMIAGIGGSMVFNNHISLTLDHVQIAHVWDDALNMGANFVRIYAQTGPRTLEVDGSRAQDFQPGDTLSLWDWTTKQETGRVKIVSIMKGTSNPQTAIVQVDQTVRISHPGYAPDKSKSNDKDGIDRAIDLDSAGTLHVIASRFQSLHARDIMLKAAHSIIENSLFYNTPMGGIIIGPEFFWDEGPPVQDIIIRNNIFKNVSGTNVLILPGAGHQMRYNTRITVTGNNFDDYGWYKHGIMGEAGKAVILQNVSGGNVSGNKLAPHDAAATDGVETMDSTNVAVSSNGIAAP